jgi:hypothetical protein
VTPVICVQLTSPTVIEYTGTLASNISFVVRSRWPRPVGSGSPSRL